MRDKIETSKWFDDIPYEVKDRAISDACISYSNAVKKYKKDGVFSTIKYRKKGSFTTFGIPARSIKKKGIYSSYLGKLQYSENINFKETKLSRIQITKSGKFYLLLPISDVSTEYQEHPRDIIALDPGVRTFQSYYSTEECGEMGRYANLRIIHLLKHADKLQSKYTISKKRSFQIARFRILDKIDNLIHELHYKTANWITKTYKMIFLPIFESQKMSRKLNRTTSRELLYLKHFQFQEILKRLSSKNHAILKIVTEEYTSKTCGKCGELNNVKGSKDYVCQHCNLQIDRDINGARNIFIKTIMT
jgi:putative transposase